MCEYLHITSFLLHVVLYLCNIYQSVMVRVFRHLCIHSHTWQVGYIAQASQNRACAHGTSAKPARIAPRGTLHSSRQRLMQQLPPLLIPTLLTSSLLTPDWPRPRPRCCCCCCWHSAVVIERRENGSLRQQRQTHQTVNDVLDVRITFVRLF